MKKRTKMRIAKLCIMSLAISTFTGFFSRGGVYAADTWNDIGSAKIKSAQPHFVGYTVRNIESWDNTTDPFSDLMRARVPLQTKNDRFPATQANPNLDGKAEVMLMQGDYGNSFFDSTIANNSYGNVAFPFWQYTDYFCPWHGAATAGSPVELYDPAKSHYKMRGFEFGVLNIPNQAYINAAHKNGVKAIACVYFDPAYRPGQTKKEMFVKDTNGKYPVADRLVELAHYYGIDGYFLNDEEMPPSPEFKEFMSYLSSKGMYTQFYDTNSSFNPSKSQWLKDSEHGKIHDSVFVNYGWTNVEGMVAHANEIGVDPHKAVFLGIEANHADLFRNHPESLVKDSYKSETDKNPLASIALFTPSDVYQRGLDGLAKQLNISHEELPVHQRPEYQWMLAERERMYFSGVKCNPKNTGSVADYSRPDVFVKDASYWPGVADFKAESSVIRGNKFFTTFNIGKGVQYFVDGKAVNDEAWTNLNDQDILPTWQWWFDSNDEKLKADFDFGKKEERKDVKGDKITLPFEQVGAYQGGSSLAVYGELSGKNNLRLFKTDLAVTATSKAKIAFRKSSDDSAKMKLGLIFADAPDEMKELEITGTETKENAFKEAVVDLTAYAGKKIAAIALVFEGAASKYQMNIGSISVSDEDTVMSAPDNFKIDRVYDDKQMVFSWTKEDYSTVDKYRVYAESEGEKHFLGGIYDEKLYVKDYFFEKGKNIKFSLVKVCKDGRESTAAVKEVDFSKLPTDVAVEEISPTGKFMVSEAAHNEDDDYEEVEKTITLHKEAKTSEELSFSFKKGADDGTGYEVIVNPIKEYTDDTIQAEYKTEINAENGNMPLAGVNDGYFYDLTIKPKNSEIGISYRGKFNDSYAKPMTLDDVVWAKEKMIALRSPLTRDWYEVKVEFQIDGEAEKKPVSSYKRGITSNYHLPFTLPAEKGNIIVTLKDYKGNETPLVIPYDEAYKKALKELRDSYLPIVKDRELAKTMFTNADLDTILDELKTKLDEVDKVTNTLKDNKQEIDALTNQIKGIYGRLTKNNNIVNYKLKIIVPQGASPQLNVSFKNDEEKEINPLSTKNYIYEYILEKGKTYNYEITSSGYGMQIFTVKGSVEAKVDEIKEITVEKAPYEMVVKAKVENAVKRTETIDKNNYEVELVYSYSDIEKLPLSNDKFEVTEPDTSTLGEKEVKVEGFGLETTFKIMVVPNDSDSAELRELWTEVKKAKELKDKAEYKYAAKELKEAFDGAVAAAEDVIRNNEIDNTELIKSRIDEMRKAASALDGLSRRVVASASAPCALGSSIENIVDGKPDTQAQFDSTQNTGDWVQLTYPYKIKITSVTIDYTDVDDSEIIAAADIEVKNGAEWKKIGSISKEENGIDVDPGKEPITSEVRLKITEDSADYYSIAEFRVDYEEVKEDPNLLAAKKALSEEVGRAKALKDTIKYKKASKDRKDRFDEVLKRSEELLDNGSEENEIVEAINLLKEASKALDGKIVEEDNTHPNENEDGGVPPVVYPPIPSKPEKTEEKENTKKEEEKKTEEKNDKTEIKEEVGKEAEKEANNETKKEIQILKGKETKTGKVKAVVKTDILTDKKVQITAGDKSYSIYTSKKLKAGDKVKIFIKKGNRYEIVSKESNTVGEKGLALSLASGNDYVIVDMKAAKKIEDKIFNSIKLKKNTISVEVGEKAAIKLSSKVDKENIKSISYIVKDKNISVNKKGLIKGKISGTVDIVVKIRLKNDKVKIVKLKVKVNKK